jgi:hypothetical protein
MTLNDPATQELLFNFVLSLVDRLGNVKALIDANRTGTPISAADLDGELTVLQTDIDKLKAEIANQKTLSAPFTP